MTSSFGRRPNSAPGPCCREAAEAETEKKQCPRLEKPGPAQPSDRRIPLLVLESAWNSSNIESAMEFMPCVKISVFYLNKTC